MHFHAVLTHCFSDCHNNKLISKQKWTKDGFAMCWVYDSYTGEDACSEIRISPSVDYTHALLLITGIS